MKVNSVGNIYFMSTHFSGSNRNEDVKPQNSEGMILAEAGKRPNQEQIEAFRNILDEIKQNPDIQSGSWDSLTSNRGVKELKKQLRLNDGTNVLYKRTENTVFGDDTEDVYIDRSNLNTSEEHVIRFHRNSNGGFSYETNSPYMGKKVKYILLYDENQFNRSLGEDFSNVLNEIESMPDIQQGKWDYSRLDESYPSSSVQINSKTVTLKDGSLVEYIQTVDSDKQKYRGTDIELPNKKVKLVFGRGDSFSKYVSSCETDFNVNDNGEIEYYWHYTPSNDRNTWYYTERSKTPILSE